jgi:ligand-binding sensor domain-containing protein
MVRFENQWRPLRVVNIVEDRFGALWIGTQEEGLIRYNGVRSITYTHQPGDSTTLAFRVINQILEDTSGEIWVACRGGLAKYDRNSGRFYNYSLRIKDQVVNLIQITELEKNRFLCMTSAHGLQLFDANRNNFQNIQTPLVEKGYYHYLHRSIKNGALYCINNGYIGIWQTTKQNFQISTALDSQKYMKGDPVVNGVYEDSSGIFWIYRTDGTIYQYDAVKNSLLRTIKLKNSPPNEFSLNKPPVFFDCKFWIPTGVKGLFVLDTATGEEQTITLSEKTYNTGNEEIHLSSDRVFTLLVDKSGNLWVGTFGGIYKYVPSKSRFKKVTSYSTDLNKTIPVNRVLHFYEQDSENYIICTMGGEMHQYSLATGKGRPISINDKKSARKLPGYCVLKKSNDIILIGTDSGIIHYNSKQQQIVKTHFFSSKIPHINKVLDILALSPEKYLLASMPGVIEYNAANS